MARFAKEQIGIETMTKILLLWLACVSGHFCSAIGVSAEQVVPTETLFRVVDINVGESQSVRLCNGKEATVKLLDLQERRDPIRNAVREARVVIEINGLPAELVSATYHLPKQVGDVQIDCSITKGYNSNGAPESWALDKDARLRLWPADSPLLQPGTFVYPVKQRWFALKRDHA